MIDFHSHILPLVDDGSRSVNESCELLKLLARQGIEKVVATPHFYAERESVDEFLLRRKASFEALSAEMSEGMPEVLLGAEVRYYQGISNLKGLRDLRIDGSDLLLLEMPNCRWTEYIIKELAQINNIGSITIVLAHIERYELTEYECF